MLSNPCIVLQAYDDSIEIHETNSVEANTVQCKLGYNFRFNDLIIIQIKVLHHLACFELTVERHRISYRDPGSINTAYSSYLIGERLTLKYM
jgi:hypothetical protein